MVWPAVTCDWRGDEMGDGAGFTSWKLGAGVSALEAGAGAWGLVVYV
jgi:hypothetical protein